MKKLLVISLALTLLLGVAACGSGTETGSETKTEAGDKDNGPASKPEEKIQLKLYAYDVDNGKQAHDIIIPQLEEKFNVSIERIHRADGTGVELKTMAAIGEMPDIFEVKGPAIVDVLVQSGDIMALDDMIEEQNLAEVIDVDKYVYPKASEDGHVYVLEYQYPDTFIIIYNKALFEEYGVKPPTNYDEFKEAVKVFRKNDIIPYALFGAQPWPGVALYDQIVSRIDPLGIKGLLEGKSEVTDEAFVTAAKQLEELAALGFVSKSAFSTNASQAFEYIKTGKAAMVGNGTWYLKKMPALGDEFAYLDNPLSVPGKEEETLYNRTGGTLVPQGYSINPNGKHVELCEEILAEYVLIRAQTFASFYGLPNVLKEDIQPDKPRHAQTEKYAQEIPKIKTFTYFPNSIPNLDIQSALFDNVNAVIAGVMTADEFIKEMDKTVKEFR